MSSRIHQTTRQPERAHLVVFVVFGILLTFPFTTHAGLTLKADEMCVPVFQVCGCMTLPCKGGCCPANNMFKCACWDDPPGGRVSGTCVANLDCKGESFTGQGGGIEGMGNLKQFLDMLKKLMEKGGGEGGGGGESQLTASSTACTSYYQVTAPSSDPCAYYVPPVSDSLLQSGAGTDASRELLDALGSNADSAQGINFTAGSSDGSQSLTDQAVEISAPPPNAAAPGTGNLLSGTEGNIVVGETGATIFARSRDVGQNIEAAGFFGVGAFFGNVQSAVANMCRSRPWANSIVSFLIPPTFFDGLCAWRGYQVGTPPPPPPESPAPPAKKSVPPAPLPAATTTPVGEPKVDIWAVPPSVPLGARTTVFWNAKNVDSCTITSSDTSFNEHALSGGAATVPLSGATTFTISCLTPGGKSITDSVTVNLAI